MRVVMVNVPVGFSWHGRAAYAAAPGNESVELIYCQAMATDRIGTPV